MAKFLYRFKMCGFSQATGNTVISKPVAPSSIIHQGSPAPTSLPVTTTLHRPPVLQVVEARKALSPSVQALRNVADFIIFTVYLVILIC